MVTAIFLLYISHVAFFSDPRCEGGLCLQPVKAALCTPLIGRLNTNGWTHSPFPHWLSSFIMRPISPQCSKQGAVNGQARLQGRS
ncbi:hypothetical protein GGS24DRAFT_453847 [Hypoxylon argillaceum]|nr:hypothetical protein GGS24DRAFT_453847 [Hypoxylon argillaceum]